MSDTEQELTDARMPGEPDNWYARFLLYRNMGAARRSFLATYTAYQLSAGKGQIKPYKDIPGSWKDIADKWQWKARAALYDARLQTEQDERDRLLREAEAAEIERIMSTGYAAKHERVKGLDNMARLIEESWVDPKDKDKIIFKFLSADKVREYRGCLDDIAKELGERKNKTELTGKDGGPLEFITDWGGGVLAEEQEEASE